MKSALERIHFMDSMRAILMMLGVVFHSAYVYAPDSHWLISSADPVDFAKSLASAIHIFRMPAFFVVSGFFCVLTITKYGWRKFLRIRIVRIFIPLVVTAVTLNSLQVILITNHTMAEFSLRDYLLEGVWLQHLWFLVNLLIYFLIAALLIYSAERPLTRIVHWIRSWLVAIPMLFVIFLMPIATVGIIGLKRVGLPLDANYLGVFEIASIMLYSPYFIFGAILAGESKLLSRLSGISPLISIPLLAVAYFAREIAERLNHFAESVALVYLDSLTAWLCTTLCFYIFKTFFNKQSTIWLFLSDASYTVYLFHMVVVVSVGIVLIRLNVSGWIGLPVLILITAFVTLAIHAFVIRKNRVARMLYNGK